MGQVRPCCRFTAAQCIAALGELELPTHRQKNKIITIIISKVPPLIIPKKDLWVVKRASDLKKNRFLFVWS